VKAEYVDNEAKLRAQYNIDMTPWRNKKPRKKRTSASRTAMQEQSDAKLPGKQMNEQSSAAGLEYDPLMAVAHGGTQSMQQRYLGSVATGLRDYSLPGPGHADGSTQLFSSDDRLRMFQGSSSRAVHGPIGAQDASMFVDPSPLTSMYQQQLLQQFHTAQQPMITNIQTQHHNLGRIANSSQDRIILNLLLDQALDAQRRQLGGQPDFSSLLQAPLGNNQFNDSRFLHGNSAPSDQQLRGSVGSVDLTIMALLQQQQPQQRRQEADRLAEDLRRNGFNGNL
jgi:hypothetical protein